MSFSSVTLIFNVTNFGITPSSTSSRGVIIGVSVSISLVVLLGILSAGIVILLYIIRKREVPEAK